MSIRESKIHFYKYNFLILKLEDKCQYEKLKKMKFFEFEECWERIKQVTKIKNFVQLAEIVETSVSNITKRKKENIFPVEWAFKIGQKYGILTEWIMTGNGPKTLTEQTKKEAKSAFLAELEAWALEVSGNNNIEWLEKQLEACLPTWKMWREEQKKDNKNNKIHAA